MPEITLDIIILVLLVIYLSVTNYLIQKRAHEREKDLINRLMSKDFTQYVVGTQDLKEPAGEVPTAEEVAAAIGEDNDGYGLGGVPVDQM